MRVAIAAALILAACSPARAGSDTIEVDIIHSKFSPASITVAAGTTVTFVVANRDPIDHEFIVGDEAVQLVHERGTEEHHGDVPGEISVPAGSTRETTFTFRSPGRLIAGCHLPGHYDYGMRAEITVTR